MGKNGQHFFFLFINFPFQEVSFRPPATAATSCAAELKLKDACFNALPFAARLPKIDDGITAVPSSK